VILLVDAQTIGILVTAASVTVAAVYYVMTLRTQQRNMKLTLETRRVNLIDSITTRIVNVEGMRRYFELMNYEWKDYEDFENKYGSDNNIDSAAKRYSVWSDYNTIGTMVRNGIINIEDLYDMGQLGIVFLWAKYRSIIEEGRKRYNGKNYLRDFEYLADEVLKYVKVNDPEYRIPESLTRYVPDK